MRDRWFIESSGVRIVALTIAFLLPTFPVHAQTDPSIDRLIEGLGSPEARVRDESAAAIQKIGQPARIALRRATHHPIPEVSHRAWGLLGRLPFYLPTDSPQVKACLFDYEIDDEEGRLRRIEQLSKLEFLEARRALARLARDEPAHRLRWKAVAPLASCEDETVLAEIRDLRPDARDPAQLVLAGWAWRRVDPARAMKLLRRAMEMDTGLGPDSTEMAGAVVPLLKGLGMNEEAQRTFEAIYRPLKDELAAAPDDAARLNGLALYCVRCDERLSDALDLATRAVAAQPDNPALLDTLAEVNFRMGHADEAVRLGKRAMELRPNDDFSRKQLERFMAAVE